MSEPQAAEAEKIERPPKSKGGRPRKGNELLTEAKVKELYRKGYRSPTSMAEAVGCTVGNAGNQISRYITDFEGVNDYRENRSSILADKQRILIKSITDAEVKEMNVRDRVVAFGILYDKERLENGQSTQNVASLHSIADRAIKAVSAANPPVKDNLGIDTVQSGNE